jgi:hypothetical protein
MTRKEYLAEMFALEAEIEELLLKLYEAKDMEEFEFYRQMIKVNINAIKALQKL